MFAPTTFARTLAVWHERARFRASLGRLVEDPHMARDFGFELQAVVAERSRLPWQPVRLRRGAPAAGVSPVAARRT